MGAFVAQIYLRSCVACFRQFHCGPSPVGFGLHYSELVNLTSLLNLVQEGAVYPCTVQSIRDYGAMVRLDSGQEMLLHISELADHRVGSANSLMLTEHVFSSLGNHDNHLAIS